MSLVPQYITLLCNSDETVGALNKSQDGSSFSVQLDTPISIPRDAVGCYLSVVNASVWNVSYNISAEIGNNTFTFRPVGDVGEQTIIIPDGQYSLEAFNLMIQRELEALNLATDLFVFTGDEASSRVIITFGGNYEIDFTVPNSPIDVLGFNARIVQGPVATGDQTAQFNRVNSYIITSNLVSNGIPVNSSGAGVIANIPIDVKPGRLITFQPRNPVKVDASELIGHSKNYFDIRLRDQNVRPVNTIGENFTVLISIEYYMPYEHIKTK